MDGAPGFPQFPTLKLATSASLPSPQGLPHFPVPLLALLSLQHPQLHIKPANTSRLPPLGPGSLFIPPQLQHHPAEDSRARPPCPSSLRLQPLPTPLLPKAQIFGAGMSKGKFTRKGRLLSYLEAKYTRVMVAEALHLKRFSMYKAEFSWRGMYRLRSTGGVCPGPLSSANFVTL